MLTTELSRYKMIVFANCFRFDEGERERILGKVSGKLVVWHYAAGIMAPGCSPDNYTRLTGFRMREIERWDDVFCGYSSGYSNGQFQKAGRFPAVLSRPGRRGGLFGLPERRPDVLCPREYRGVRLPVSEGG